jgi:serine/threonine-protein kinase/endoribonuclease IRE1
VSLDVPVKVVTDENSIELSPFTFPQSPSRIFTGSKHTSLLTLDLRTGQQLDTFGSRGHSHALNFSQFEEEGMCEDDDLLDDLEAQSRAQEDVLFVGRSDYRLTIHNPSSQSGVLPSSSTPTGQLAARKSGVQEISYSTYTPNTYDRPLADFWSKVSSENIWTEEAEKKIRVELGHDGVAMGIEEGGRFSWATNLGSVGYVGSWCMSRS